MRTRIWAVLVFSTATVMAACGTGSDNSVISAPGATTTSTNTTITTVPASSTNSTVASPASTRAATSTTKAHTSVTTGGPLVLGITAADDGSTYTMHRGDRLNVTLGSTYWSFQPVSNAAVLSQQGAPVVMAAPFGTCVPGGGCGTVTATFAAVAAGRSAVVATRTSCGEAMGCTGTAGHFGVTIIVV